MLQHFPKSCLKVAPFFSLLQISLALVNLLLIGFSASFDHGSTSELKKGFSSNELLHLVAAILEIVVQLEQRR